MNTHSAAVRDILRVLGGFPGLRLWQVTQGVAVPLTQRSPRRFGTVTGAADLSGVIAPNGRRLEIEVKTGSGRLSKQQRAYLDTMRRFGAVAFVAHDVEDAFAQLAAWGYPRSVLTEVLTRSPDSG